MKMMIAAAFTALLLLGACSSSVCEDACEKQKSCVQSLDCNSLEPMAKGACELSKQMLGQLDCSAAGDACSGEAEQAAEALDSCDLDPNTCDCKK